MKTAKEILTEICNDNGVNWFTEKKIIEAMEKYAAQFRKLCPNCDRVVVDDKYGSYCSDICRISQS